jgi:hypothetical protein
MSKRRNNHLRKALELVCQFMRDSLPEPEKDAGDVLDAEYWYALACSHKERKPSENPSNETV